MSGPDEIARERDRLDAVERELARLRHRQDIAMSAFRFEEATALGPMIAALEDDRSRLAAALPDPPPAPTDTRPVLLTRRHRRRQSAR